MAIVLIGCAARFQRRLGRGPSLAAAEPQPLTPLPVALYGWMGSFAVLLLAFSGFRHASFNSTAYDLGIFDQAAYLISQGLSPISSYMGYHILGDHAALVWYPIALLYRLYPTVYWLLGVQAIALAAGSIPAYRLGQQAGLSLSRSLAVAIAYLLYPVVFNANLFDFHPDVLAIPLLLQALVEVQRRPGPSNQSRGHVGAEWRFGLCLMGILACKAALALTVIGFGVWLALAKRWRLALLALITGAVWFWVASQWIVPSFSGQEAGAVGRYSYLGDSVVGIAKTLVTQPQRILRVLFSSDNLGYLVLVFAPVGWALSPPGLRALVGAIPCLGLNLLADYDLQKDVIHHYTLPALPFLVLMGVTTLAHGRGWVQSRRGIVIWAMVGFVALAKFTYVGDRYWPTLDTWQASQGAIARVDDSARVLATTAIAAHLSHRPQIQAITNGMPLTASTYGLYDAIAVNARHPGVQTSRETIQHLLAALKTDPAFTPVYAQSEVYLFQRRDRETPRR